MAWPWLRRPIKVAQGDGPDRVRLFKVLRVTALALRVDACSNC